MIRYLKFLFLAVLGLILFVLALANRDMVVLRVVTDDAARVLGIPNQVSLPLFAVILAALVAGIIVGLVWEWFREHQYRAEASRKRREAEALKRDLNQIKGPGKTGTGADDVLALLEPGR